MNFAEHLKSQLDIVEVVGQYVRLKRQGAGTRYVGLCPFHSEKTPSFGVHSTLQYYKCFGCDAAGDVLKFVQQIESLTFPETLKLLAERYGIPMPDRERSTDPEAQRRAALLEMHEIAAETFQNNLRGSNGSDARRYIESRGVSRGSMDEFRLGLSDPSGQQLVSRLQRFGAALLEESGLAIKRQEGGFFDRFRNRLMFPIHSESGKVIAFGGRALRAGDEPKYLNSPETRLYKKSTVLYNLHRAKIDARKQNQMILVEGYMDVIGVYSAGIHEVVASSGTALGGDQVRSMKRQISHQAGTGQIILNFDPDPAGARSTEKYISSLLAEGLRVRVLEIPGGLDPDEYIQQNGADAYRKLLANAGSYFHWLADRARTKFDVQTAEGRVDAFKFIAPVIEQVHDRIERSAIAAEMAEYLKLDRSVITETFRKQAPAQPHRPQKAPDRNSGLPPNEKILLTCLLASAPARDVIRNYLAASTLLPLLELKPIFETAIALEAEGVPFHLEALTARLDPRLQRIIMDITFSDSGVSEETAADQALSCLKALEAKSVDALREKLRLRIRELERGGNFEEALRVADELNKIQNRPTGA